jgi:hypothetical protein
MRIYCFPYGFLATSVDGNIFNGKFVIDHYDKLLVLIDSLKSEHMVERL